LIRLGVHPCVSELGMYEVPVLYNQVNTRVYFFLKSNDAYVSTVLVVYGKSYVIISWQDGLMLVRFFFLFLRSLKLTKAVVI